LIHRFKLAQMKISGSVVVQSLHRHWKLQGLWCPRFWGPQFYIGIKKLHGLWCPSFWGQKFYMDMHSSINLLYQVKNSGSCEPLFEQAWICVSKWWFLKIYICISIYWFILNYFPMFNFGSQGLRPNKKPWTFVSTNINLHIIMMMYSKKKCNISNVGSWEDIFS
jgi:hypothetical protein